jgi:uncharacterized protein (DUF305 family)
MAVLTVKLSRPLVAMAFALVALALLGDARAAGPASAFDRAFMTEMVSHHAMAVEMGEMAREKATRPQLKRVAGTIVRTQTAEIARMQRWLRAWYGTGATPRMTAEDRAQMRELERAEGDEFQIRFMALMTVHHSLAIERARVARSAASHVELRRLARAIIAAQDREVKQVRAWLVAWYAR